MIKKIQYRTAYYGQDCCDENQQQNISRLFQF